MSLNSVKPGNNIPNEINVIIEIAAGGQPVKYEVDKESGLLVVDRFLGTAMYYPTNYGYVPCTLSEDGDPTDVLVITPVPLIPGAVIACRPVGVLNMTDEAGTDAKILAVPTSKLSKQYDHIKSITDVCPHLLDSIAHFFGHYKDLEKGKWVKVGGWDGIDAAHREILGSVERYKAE